MNRTGELTVSGDRSPSSLACAGRVRRLTPKRAWPPPGLWLALGAAFGFRSRPSSSLVYPVPQAVPVDAVTLLSLRMVFALPVFLWVGFRSSRGAAAHNCRAATGCC